MSSVSVLVCILCAGIMLARPEDFVTGKCCTSEEEVVTNPYRVPKSGVANTKWRKMSRASQYNVSSSDKKCLRNHIIDNLIRKAEKKGVKAINYRNLVDANEAEDILRSAD